MIHEIITHPAWSVFTALVGYLIGHLLSGSRDRHQAYLAAAANFRKAFEEEMYWFCPEKSGLIVRNILADCKYRHECAYKEFRLHIAWYRRRSFSNAWCYYRKAVVDAEEAEKIAKFHVARIGKTMSDLVAYGNP